MLIQSGDYYSQILKRAYQGISPKKYVIHCQRMHQAEIEDMFWEVVDVDIVNIKKSNSKRMEIRAVIFITENIKKDVDLRKLSLQSDVKEF